MLFLVTLCWIVLCVTIWGRRGVGATGPSVPQDIWRKIFTSYSQRAESSANMPDGPHYTIAVSSGGGLSEVKWSGGSMRPNSSLHSAQPSAKLGASCQSHTRPPLCELLIAATASRLCPALRCLKKLKGRVWGLFGTVACRPIVPLPQGVPLIHLQRRHAPHRHERPLLTKEGTIQGISLAHRNSRRYYVLLRAAKLGHRTDSCTSPPLRRKACGGFFRCPKNPATSAGFEPANSGTRGQHANH